MTTMEHHNTTPFLAFMTLILAGIVHFIQELHAAGVLHYIFVTAEGLMYLASFAVGCITVYKFFHKKH